VLLALGVLVGAAAGVGLLVGFEPARLPATLLNIAAYKLTFLAAVGLLGAGASLLRHARRETPPDPAARVPTNRAKELGEGRPGRAAFTQVRQREHAQAPSRPSQERAR